MKSSPMPRRRTKPRTYKTPRCKTLRCGKPAKVAEWCNTHALREADRLARIVVMERDGKCRVWDMQHLAELARFPCQGSLQWCHIHSRSYKAIRHDPRNAIVMCAAHHAYFTHHPLEWETWCRDHDIPWDTLRLEALHGAASWSLAETLERLQGRAA